MNLLKIALSFLLCIYNLSLFSQPSVQWSRSVTNSRGQFLLVDSSEQIYTAGVENGFSNSFYAFINKYDSAGNQLWTINPPFGNTGLGNMVLDDSANLYLCSTSHIYSDPSTMNCAAACAKFDSSGNLIWLNEYRRNNSVTFNSGNDIVLTGSGDVWLKGLTEDSADSYKFDLLIKYSASGQILNIITDSLNPNGSAFKICKDTIDNIYYAGSYRTGFNTVVKIFKYDFNGNRLWEVNDSGSSNYNDVINIQYFNSCIYILKQNKNINTGFEIQKYDLSGQLLDTFAYEDSLSDIEVKNFLIASSGNIYFYGNREALSDIFALKIKSDFSLEYVEYLDFGNAMIDLVNFAILNVHEEFYLTGRNSWDIQNNYSESFICKLDTSGIVQWIVADHELNSTWNEGNRLILAGDKLYTLATAYLPGIGPQEIIKKYVDIINSNDNISIKQESIKVYPNPSAKDFHFSLPEFMRDKQVEISIYDIFGRQCLNGIYSGREIVIPSDEFHPGLYYFYINFQSRRFSGKIVVE